MEMRFRVEGMTCGHCEAAVREAVLNVDPAAHVAIDRANGSVVITSDAAAETFRQAITDQGYAASLA